MDNDTAGQAANKRISDKLFIQGIKHEILVPEFKDWNEDRLAAGGNAQMCIRDRTGTIEYGTNGMPDIGADTMFNNATEKGTLDTLPEIPGLALWHSGHIGIYIGGGKVIHAANTHASVIISDVSGSGFTHWLKIPYITYTENTESQ